MMDAVFFQKKHPKARMPRRATPESAGWDFYAVHRKVLKPGEWALIHTGIWIALPKGYEMQIRPRSGLALKHGLTVLNSPGTVDSDYRGEIQILLINFGKDSFEVKPGMRIAQGIVHRHAADLPWIEVDALPQGDRGEHGFGHSGLT